MEGFRKKTIFAVALTAGLVAVMPASAAPISAKTNSSEAVVDSSSATRTVDILAADLGGALDKVTSVAITIDFMKCGGTSLLTPLPSGCTDRGPAAAREIIFKLTNPAGTAVSLVEANAYFGPGTSDPTPGARITVAFDATATEFVGFGGFVGGTFLPIGSLGDFTGGVAVGTWELLIEDDSADAPLGFASFTLAVTVADRVAAIPEPAPVLLLGFGLAGWWALRRRRVVI